MHNCALRNWRLGPTLWRLTARNATPHAGSRAIVRSALRVPQPSLHGRSDRHVRGIGPLAVLLTQHENDLPRGPGFRGMPTVRLYGLGDFTARCSAQASRLPWTLILRSGSGSHTTAAGEQPRGR